jgi:hypothetical protein
MATAPSRAICWTPIWNNHREGVGLEHLLVTERTADSVVLAIDDERGPFGLGAVSDCKIESAGVRIVGSKAGQTAAAEMKVRCKP